MLAGGPNARAGKICRSDVASVLMNYDVRVPSNFVLGVRFDAFYYGLDFYLPLHFPCREQIRLKRTRI